MYVLSKFAERYQAPTYSGLIRKALGRKLSASEPQASLMLSSKMVMSLRSSVPHEPFATCKGCTIKQGLPSEVPDGDVFAFTVLCWSLCGCAGLSVILILYLWGSCIAYLVIIGDSFSPLLALATGTCNTQISQCCGHAFLMHYIMACWAGSLSSSCQAACVADFYRSLNEFLSKPVLSLSTFQAQLRGVDVVMQAQTASLQTGGL